MKATLTIALLLCGCAPVPVYHAQVAPPKALGLVRGPADPAAEATALVRRLAAGPIDVQIRKVYTCELAGRGCTCVDLFTRACGLADGSLFSWDRYIVGFYEDHTVDIDRVDRELRNIGHAEVGRW